MHCEILTITHAGESLTTSKYRETNQSVNDLHDRWFKLTDRLHDLHSPTSYYSIAVNAFARERDKFATLFPHTNYSA